MTARVTGGGVQTGTAPGSNEAAEASRRAAEAARRAAEEAQRKAQEAAAAAQRARAESSSLKGAGPLKQDPKVTVAETKAKKLDTDARKATERANASALAAGQPLPFPQSAAPSARNTLLLDGGDFSARTKTSLFGNPTLGAEPMRLDAETRAVAPASVTQTAATTGASTAEGAQQALVDAKEAYEDAHEKSSELTEKLNQELAKLGPALTEEQKQQYVAEFRARYPDEYAAEAAAAKTLNAALNDPKLLEAAKNNPDVAKECVEAAKLLAESPEAKGALEWAGKALDPQGPAGTAFAQLQTQIEDDVAAPALATAAGQLLAENGGDVQAALKALADITKPLVNLGKGGSAIKNGIETIKAALASGDPGPLMKLAEGGSKLSIALAGVGAAFGLVSAVNDAQRGEWGDFVKNLANAGRGGAQAAAGVLRVLGESGRIAASTGEAAASFLLRLAPALGVVANAIVLADHFKDFLDDPTVGGGIQALGDAIAVIGAGVGTVVPGVGQIIEGVGLILSAFGGLFANKEKQEKLDNESEEILKKMGLDSDIAETLAHGDDQPARLAEQLGLTPAQIQQLARTHPLLFDAPGLGQAAIDAAEACGMKGAEALRFMDEMAKTDPEFAWDLLGVQGAFQGDGMHPTATADSWRAYVENRYPEAFAYAKDHAPELFGASAESRRQADRDFERNAGVSDFPLVYARLCNEHKGDDAYTSEFIQNMKDNGYLESFVQFIDQNGLDMDRDGAKVAIEAALRTGVLTEAELKKYLDGENGDAWRSLLGR
ncbi:hypothetical protein ACN469_37040 [Corallococcus terminator]